MFVLINYLKRWCVNVTKVARSVESKDAAVSMAIDEVTVCEGNIEKF